MTGQDNQPDRGVTRRELFKDVGIAAAALPWLPVMLPETAAAGSDIQVAAGSAEIGDPAYRSASGWHFGTEAIHAGEQQGYQVTPISQDKAAPCYQRPGNLANPTVAALLRKLMEMEGTEAAAGAPCGMGIIAQTYLALLKPGDRLLAHRCNYDWVMTLFRQYLPSWGVEVKLVDFTDPRNLANELRAKPAKAVHWEPCVNPTMEVLDTPALIRIAKDAGAMVIVDNTWLTPFLLQPFRHGADLVIHSATKYLGGHGNAMGGVVSGKKELVGRIEQAQNWLGGLLRPMEAFLITQGVKTLPLRMRRHSGSAQRVAEFLQSHPAVARVRYGGLPSWNPHPTGPLRAFGGMLGVEWKQDAVHQNFGKHVKLALNATSLGDPVTRVTARNEEGDRGIPPRYTRISIGLEDPEDIIADFEQALGKC